MKLKTSFKKNFKISSALCNLDDLVNFEILSVVNNKSRKITPSQLNVTDNKFNICNLKKRFSHLSNINFTKFQTSEFILLIETYLAGFLIYKDPRSWKEGKLLAVETLLWFTIPGGSYKVKDIHWENTSSSKTQAFTKSANLDLWIIGSLNQIFLNGFYNPIKFSNE